MIGRLLNTSSRVSDRIRERFKRRTNLFICRLQQQCELNIEAADALRDYMSKPNKKNAKRVRQLERDADEVRRMLVDELNRTFVTPIDREDIHVLSRAIDDILDDTWSTINEMDILEVEPNKSLKDMVDLISQGAEEIKLAIDRLTDHPGVASKDLEYVATMLKLREIYRHLYHAAGRIGDAANTVEDIVVKFF
jgi:uncharacterized protein Yka (UPF0111/DUF47 family)